MITLLLIILKLSGALHFSWWWVITLLPEQIKERLIDNNFEVSRQ